MYINGDFGDKAHTFSKPNDGRLINNKFYYMTLLKLFELFLLMILSIEKIKKYSSDELRCFIEILILSGYNHVPSKQLYWE